MSAYSASSGDVGTVVLTIECTNQFTGAGSPVTKDFNVVLSVSCLYDAIVAAAQADLTYTFNDPVQTTVFATWTFDPGCPLTFELK